MRDIQRYQHLFKGNERGHLKYSPETNTLEYYKTPATEALYSQHLEGKYSLGVGTITDEGYCYFGCIDYDTHDTDEDADFRYIEERIATFGYPLVVCRSKGGGAHLYLFLKEKEKTAKVKKSLLNWAERIFPKKVFKVNGKWPVDIFPCQDKLGKNEDGKLRHPKCLNLPYFNSVDTARYSIHQGKKFSLEDFLNLAESRAVYLDDCTSDRQAFITDAPPCLQTLIKKGVNSNRNIALYNFSVFFRKYDSENWRELARKVNDEYFNPPLEKEEVRRVIDNVRKQEYFYKCKEEPCQSICNSKKCVKSKYGIGQEEFKNIGSLTMPDITSIKKYNAEVPKFELTIDDRKILVSMEILYEWRKLRIAISEQTNKILPSIKAVQWEAILAPLMENLVTVETPMASSPTGIIQAKLIEFIKCGDLNSTGKDESQYIEILKGYPILYVDKGIKYAVFKGSDFIAFLKTEKAEELKGPSLWIAMYKAFGICELTLPVNSKKIPVWAVKYSDDWNIRYTNRRFEVEF